MAAGVGVAVLPRTGCAGKATARGTLGSNPKRSIEPAGHLPVGVRGWLRMTCMMIGDPRSRTGGRFAGAGSGPRGVILLQAATASMRPAAASALARTDSGHAGPVMGWAAMPSMYWNPGY